MSPDEINEYLATQFPHLESVLFVESVDECGIRVQLPFHDRFLRPGGTISGPSIMLLADTTAYATLLVEGADSAHAVTSSLHINFIRRAEPGDLTGIGHLRKRGRRLSLVNVVVQDQVGRVVAEASVTYAMAEPTKDPIPS